MIKKNMKFWAVIAALSMAVIFPVSAVENTGNSGGMSSVTTVEAAEEAELRTEEIEETSAEETEEAREETAESEDEDTEETLVEESEETQEETTESGSTESEETSIEETEETSEETSDSETTTEQEEDSTDTTEGDTSENDETTEEEPEDDTQDDVVIVTPNISGESAYALYLNQVKVVCSNGLLEYLEALRRYSQEVCEIEKLKKELGYSTDAQLQEAELQVKSTELQIETAKGQLQFYMDCIHLRNGVYKEDILQTNLPQLTKDYVSVFLAQSSQINDYNKQINSYEQQLQKEDLTEVERQLLNSKLTNVKSEKSSYEIYLTEYVKKLELQHGTLSRQIEQYDNEIELAKLKQQIREKQYELGRLAKTEVAKGRIELQRLEYERLNCVGDLHLVWYILDNVIENQSV